MSEIKKIKLYASGKDSSKVIEEQLARKLEKLGYVISDDACDLGIAIGGDGTFLRMVRSCDFDEDTYYVGVNTGTLGFAQELYPEDIDKFLDKLVVDNYRIHDIDVQEASIYSNNGIDKYYSLNEVIVKGANYEAVHMNVKIDNNTLLKFCGDGLLICTQFGSTGQNLSYGGSIVYDGFHCLQITPMGSTTNNVYEKLDNSVLINENKVIRLVPGARSRDLVFIIDGKSNVHYYHNVDRVDSRIKKKIKCLRMNGYDYTSRVHEKIVKH